jgi:hypothetical protein
LEKQLDEQEAEQPYGQQNQSLQTATPPLFGPTNSETNMSAEVPDHDSSLAEGAAGLLAINSTADRSQNIQASTSFLFLFHFVFVPFCFVMPVNQLH